MSLTHTVKPIFSVEHRCAQYWHLLSCCRIFAWFAGILILILNVSWCIKIYQACTGCNEVWVPKWGQLTIQAAKLLPMHCGQQWHRVFVMLTGICLQWHERHFNLMEVKSKNAHVSILWHQVVRIHVESSTVVPGVASAREIPQSINQSSDFNSPYSSGDLDSTNSLCRCSSHFQPQ